MRILRNQHLATGGGGATPGKIGNIVQEPAKETAIPDDVKKINFKDDPFTSVDDFEVQQLPKTPEVEKEKIATKPAPVAKESKEEVIQDGEAKEEKEGDEVLKEVVKNEEEAPALEKEKKQELPKYLKAPKGEGLEKKEDAPKGEEKIKPLITAGKVSRDYTGHSPEEVAMLKATTNEGYTLMKKVLTENKELSKLKDATYLQHEHAYVLDPGFQSLQEDARYATKEGDYWKSQLLLIKSGKNWKPITQWDKNGNPVLGQELVPSEEAEEMVRVEMNNAYNASNVAKGQLQSYPQKYKQQIAGDLQAIEMERQKRFDWVRDPKLLEYSIEIEGFGDRSIKQIREDFTNLFPVYHRSSPGVSVAADLFVALRLQDARIKELEGSKGVEEVKQEEEGMVEPTSKAKPVSRNTKPVNGVKTFHAIEDL